MTELNGHSYVTRAEIGHRFDDILTELRLLRQEVVRRDVYDAERRGDAATMAGLRTDVDALERRLVASEESKASARRQAAFAVFAALLALAVNLLIQFIH
jgi:hypothetical protein